LRTLRRNMRIYDLNVSGRRIAVSPPSRCTLARRSSTCELAGLLQRELQEAWAKIPQGMATSLG